MTDDELVAFGKQMRELVYPLTYDCDGKPSISAFSIQLDEARAEWLRRHPSEKQRRRPLGEHSKLTVAGSGAEKRVPLTRNVLPRT